MEAIKQHQLLARGEALPTGNFGVDSAWSGAKAETDAGVAGRRTNDGARGAPPPVKHTKGMAPSQAAADHGNMD